MVVVYVILLGVALCCFASAVLRLAVRGNLIAAGLFAVTLVAFIQEVKRL